MLSGLAGVVRPKDVGEALELSVTSARSVAEVRAGLGGTYAALGGWALLSPEPSAEMAVGVTWLGAAAVRASSLRVDRPRTDGAFWGYLALEVACGVAAIVSARNRRGSVSGAPTAV
jgi:hypothetical protein